MLLPAQVMLAGRLGGRGQLLLDLVRHGRIRTFAVIMRSYVSRFDGRSRVDSSDPGAGISFAVRPAGTLAWYL